MVVLELIRKVSAPYLCSHVVLAQLWLVVRMCHGNSFLSSVIRIDSLISTFIMRTTTVVVFSNWRHQNCCAVKLKIKVVLPRSVVRHCGKHPISSLFSGHADVSPGTPRLQRLPSLPEVCERTHALVVKDGVLRGGQHDPQYFRSRELSACCSFCCEVLVYLLVCTVHEGRLHTCLSVRFKNTRFKALLLACSMFSAFRCDNGEVRRARSGSG